MEEPKNPIVTFEEHVNELAVNHGRELMKFTPQLYLKPPIERNFDVKPFASGVLITVQNKYFLITAGHVLEDDSPYNVGIMVADEFHVLTGQVKYAEPKKSKLADAIDIAVWQLDDEVAGYLKVKYDFFPWERVDVDHIIDDRSRYLIVGYPMKKTKAVYATQKLIAEPFIYLTREADSYRYTNLNLDRRLNMLLAFVQQKLKNFKTGLRERYVAPNGISGCGLWYVPSLLVPSGHITNYKLVGIMTTHEAKHSIMVATRIHIVSEALRRDFGINIPPSNIARLSSGQ